IVSATDELLPALWAFCSSDEYHRAVRGVSQKVDVATNTLVQIPFDIAYWQQVALQTYPNGLPRPHSDDPTQWIFGGSPKAAQHSLQVALARLVGYRWPRQAGTSF